MKSIKNIITVLLLLIIIGGVIYDRYIREPDHILDPNIKWKTDTVYVDKPYNVPVPYGIKVPPRIITYYEVDSSAIDSLKILIAQDSIKIHGLQSMIYIHQNYLKQYPVNPKLINLDLSFDTLSLSLLNINGTTYSVDYPIFIKYKKYNWSNDGLTSEENIRKIPKPKTYLEYKVGAGYDLLYLSPYIQGRVSKDINKFELYGRLGVGLLNNKSSEVKLGVNYNLGK